MIVMYVGFFASGSVLAGQAVGELTHLGDDARHRRSSRLVTAVDGGGRLPR